MFYGAPCIMAPPAKSRLKRQGQLLSSVLSRTLSLKSQDADTSPRGPDDDPAELSTQLSAPGVLKVFGDSVAAGAHYKSVLATGASSARELVREALKRYALSPERAALYVLCDVVGQAGDGPWRPEGLRVFGDHERPLLAQALWRPREGLARRFELRLRSDVEELAAGDVDTVTAGEAAVTARGCRAWGVSAPGSGRRWGPWEGSPTCGHCPQGPLDLTARVGAKVSPCIPSPPWRKRLAEGAQQRVPGPLGLCLCFWGCLMQWVIGGQVWLADGGRGGVPRV